MSSPQHEPWPWPETFLVPYNSVIGGHVVLMGYSVKETTGAATAELDIYDSTAATGSVYLPIPLGAGQGTEDWFGTQGIHFVRGLFSNVASGAIAGCLFIAKLAHTGYPHG